jgi:hypothetical protein
MTWDAVKHIFIINRTESTNCTAKIAAVWPTENIRDALKACQCSPFGAKMWNSYIPCNLESNTAI